MTSSLKIQLGKRGSTPYFPLSEVVPLLRRDVVIDPDESSWQGLYRVQKGDLVFSNIMAWEGAVALPIAHDDGCIRNHRMLTCACDVDRVNPAFLVHYFKTPEGMVKLVGASTGTVARNRTLTATGFGKMTVPVPPLDVQDQIVRRLDALAKKTRQIEAHLDAVKRDVGHLLALRFCDAIAHAPLRTMAEVAPLARRTVTIDPQTSYTELGVRSFYTGTFQRQTVPGSDFSWQDLCRIQSGDLVFSNIMAWKQAIAIARPEDDGCVGNHRMLTCEANPEITVPGFPWYYFTTEEGFAKIYAASPGTAARNRTITAPALMAIEVPTPPLATQQTFDRLQAEVTALKAKHTAIREANAALVPATLERVFGADTNGARQ